jgi:hypothetical protein
MPGRGIPAQLLTALALVLFFASPAMSATINVTANAPDVLNRHIGGDFFAALFRVFAPVLTVHI